MLYNFKIKKHSKKGSVLIFTLFIMMISLVAGIGIISVSNFDRQSSLSTTKTVNSFQIADMGLERALNAIKNESPAKRINQIVFFKDDCSSGEVAKDAFGGFGTYIITFYDSADTQLQCDDTIGDIKSIKSVGKYKGTNRAVEVVLPSP